MVFDKNRHCKNCLAHLVCGIYNPNFDNFAPKCNGYIGKDQYCEIYTGVWLYHQCVSSHDGTISGYSCSHCNAFVNEDIFTTDEFHKAFCGNCGALMNKKFQK